jgi:release factor glutamine methyltransferase
MNGLASWRAPVGSDWGRLYRLGAEALGDPRAARWFVEDASGGSWPGVLSWPAPERAERAFLAMVERRRQGEPVQYVLGHWAFRQLDLMVSRHVLIPRPETEVVVEVALAELDRRRSPQPRVVDLGTGSGAIALSVAWERPGAQVWAVDVSPDALAVASANLAGLGSRVAGRVHLSVGSWWEGVPGHLRGAIDLVVTNPPYITEAEMAELPAEVLGWEPRRALAGGSDGLVPLAAILQGIRAWMAPGAALVAEIAPQQAARARELAEAAGLVVKDVVADLAGRPRALVAHRPADVRR